MAIEKAQVITLSDNREYVCLSVIKTEGNKTFLYLMTTSKPVEFCFVEEIIVNDGMSKMRIVGGRDEKHRLFDLLKTQAQAQSDRGTQNV